MTSIRRITMLRSWRLSVLRRMRRCSRSIRDSSNVPSPRQQAVDGCSSNHRKDS